MKDCVTHHFACDCREEKFKELERQLSEEQSRTLRYKELLYSHTERGGRIKELEKQLAEKDEQLEVAKGALEDLYDASIMYWDVNQHSEPNNIKEMAMKAEKLLKEAGNE